MINKNFKIGERTKNLTLKVILGYVLFTVIAFGSVFYILSVMEKFTSDDSPEQEEREKAYLITRTISLLNESASIGQPIGMTEEHFESFNEAMDETIYYLDELRSLLTDSFHIQGIDTIEVLLENKKINTLQLHAVWKQMDNERPYNRNNIKKIVADTLVTQVEVKEQVETKEDSVRVPRAKKGFFKRLADAFVPPKEEIGIVVNTTRNIQTDTLVNVYNPVDTISAVLNELQAQYSKERKQLSYQLYDKAAQLRHNNVLLNTRINQILYAIEEEEMNASLQNIANRQRLLRESSSFLGFVAIIAICIIIVFSLVIYRDIARSKYYRRQLEKAKQYAEELLIKQEKFMLAISHDIRAPMSSILGYVELLLRRKPDDRQRYYLENMVSSSNHILSLVNDLLDFHHLDSGKMEIKQVAFSVKLLLDDIYFSFKPIADAKGIKFYLKLGEKGMDSNYLGDSIRIRQVVSNLLSNALKFTQKGTVVLTAKFIDDELILSVRDTGPGIPESEQDHIFGEFSRLKQEKEEGFGLGLSITQKLTELMGGEVSLQSKLGEGSEFFVHLPLEKIEKEIALNKKDVADWDEGLRLKTGLIRCLLVDDDPLQLALTEELLKQSSVEVDTCTNSKEVLNIIQKHLYNVVITDIQMPGLDGFELVKQIRELNTSWAHVLPVIALSASVANKKEDYIKAGFTGFLNKPFTAAELISVLNELLSTDLQMENKLDFSTLADFAGDDKDALNSILETFKKETSENMKKLKGTLKQTDKVEASKVAHKMIPVFSMIGANHLVQQLRLLEKNDEDMLEETWISLILELEKQVEVVMNEISDQTCGM